MEAVAKSVEINMGEVLTQNDELRCTLEAKDHQIKLLEEKVHYLLHHHFGSKFRAIR